MECIYKLTIAYDGTHYGGWQVQNNAPSIQALIQHALSTALRTPTQATGSGRTDAGVHALGQVAHFLAPPLSEDRLLASLNGILPLDIRILKVERVSDDFHARFSAKSKIYHYHLRLSRHPDPFHRLYHYHVPHPVDLALLKEGSQLFVGTHDFTSFAHRAHQGSAARNPIRTLFRSDVVEQEGGVRIELQADGFLYKMARTIVGTLLEVGGGKLPLSDIPSLFDAKDRKQSGKTAPAHGLFLVKVIYESATNSSNEGL